MSLERTARERSTENKFVSQKDHSIPFSTKKRVSGRRVRNRVAGGPFTETALGGRRSRSEVGRWSLVSDKLASSTQITLVRAVSMEWPGQKPDLGSLRRCGKGKRRM